MHWSNHCLLWVWIDGHGGWAQWSKGGEGYWKPQIYGGWEGSSITSIANLHYNTECIIVVQEMLRCNEDFLVPWSSYLSVVDAYYGCWLQDHWDIDIGTKILKWWVFMIVWWVWVFAKFEHCRCNFGEWGCSRDQLWHQTLHTLEIMKCLRWGIAIMFVCASNIEI